jgi:hypothetical protein
MTRKKQTQIREDNKRYLKEGACEGVYKTLLVKVHWWLGIAVVQWLRRCATNRKVAGSIPAGVSVFFIDIRSFRSHYGSWVDSASNRNEYQEYFLPVGAYS